MTVEAAIVSVGEELLAGDVQDSNASEIAAALRAEGLRVGSIEIVADREEQIAGAVIRAAGFAKMVIVTGGLGPTGDDLTRHGVARAAGRRLVEDPRALALILAYFDRIGREMSASNRSQALCPEGAGLIENHGGTAPGLELECHGARLFVLPGVPAEMRAMLHEHVLPAVRRLFGQAAALERIQVRAHGLAESVAGEKIAHLMGEGRDPLVGITVSGGLLTVSITSLFHDREQGRLRVEETAREVEALLGKAAFGRDQDTLEGRVVDLLKRNGQRLAIAESCTGGLVSAMITAVPGCTDVFLEGAVTYSNDAKERRLGVDPALLTRHGAVSAEVACAMALGMARSSGAEVAVSITGIAGPGGGTETKPVGLVYLGISLEGRTESRRLNLPGDRHEVQLRAARSALDLVRRALAAGP